MSNPTDEERRIVKCDVKLLDEDGLVSIEHNLGTMDVRVVLHALDGTILTPRMLTPIDGNTVEGILSEEPAYAMVTLAEDEDPDAAPPPSRSRDREVTIKTETAIRTGPMG